MKNVSIVVGCILLLFNVALCLMLSCYQTFNCVINSSIIILFVLIQCLVSILTLKDGYRVSFNCLNPLFLLIELICGSIASQGFTDNPAIIIILLLLLLQVIMLVAAVATTKSNNKL